MHNTAATLLGLLHANSRKKKLTGVLALFLTLQACASTELYQPVKAVIVNQDCPRLEIERTLLAIRPITAASQIRTNGNLEDALEIVIADHRRDRGQLIELSSAERQRVADQSVVDELCAKAASEQAKAIESASEQSVTVERPFWEGFFQ